MSTLTSKTFVGPVGAPMKQPYGSFAGKPASGPTLIRYSAMGPAGTPMRPPYGSFAGKTTIAASGLPHNLQFHATMGRLKSF